MSETMQSSPNQEQCPVCSSPEVPARTERTVYGCGSSDLDQRSGSFKQVCKEGE
ncbi:MAG: hypothetical protein KAS32_21375 [Candidatus Peribacteraceae bacterium]|nr:hypothetical protein [Candidatus Peribacteraceae bacterium]